LQSAMQWFLERDFSEAAMVMNEHSTQEQLARHAYIVGDNEDGRLPLDQIQWRYAEAFPLERLYEIMSHSEWVEWFKDEMAMKAAEYGTDQEWRRLLTEEIEDPVVILEHEGLLIWDGWHRCAAAVIKGISPKVVWGVDKTCSIDHDITPFPSRAPSFRI
jgi:alpha-mannosidase